MTNPDTNGPHLLKAGMLIREINPGVIGYPAAVIAFRDATHANVVVPHGHAIWKIDKSDEIRWPWEPESAWRPAWPEKRKSLGEFAYDVFRSHVSGHKLSAWSGVTDEATQGWESAAQAVIAEYKRREGVQL